MGGATGGTKAGPGGWLGAVARAAGETTGGVATTVGVVTTVGEVAGGEAASATATGADARPDGENANRLWRIASRAAARVVDTGSS